MVWRRPTYANIHRMIVNSAYCGAYAYGKTRASSGSGTTAVRRKDRDNWLALKPGAHEGCVSWERAEAIRNMVSNDTHMEIRLPKRRSEQRGLVAQIGGGVTG